MLLVFVWVGAVVGGVAGQCSPSPCGVNTQCDVNPAGAAVCRFVRENLKANLKSHLKIKADLRLKFKPVLELRSILAEDQSETSLFQSSSLID